MRILVLTLAAFCLAACGGSTTGADAPVAGFGGQGGGATLAGMGGQGGGAGLGTVGQGGDAGLAGTDGGAAGHGEISLQCFPCESYWTCGGPFTRIDLMPEADGCFLSGLPGRNLLSPDGTIIADGMVVGTAVGSGARVHVAYPDGSQWLFCAGGGGCPRTQ